MWTGTWSTARTLIAEWLAHPIVQSHQDRARQGHSIESWVAAIALRGTKRDRGIGIGAGTGSLELGLVASDTVGRYDLLDVSAGALEVANETARNQGIPDRVSTFNADIGTFDLGVRRYDVATCMGSLHHVADLENVLRATSRSLTPDGVLIAYEYVGPDRFATGPVERRIAQQLYGSLEPKLKSSHPELPLPDPQAVIAADPTEAVHSSEILAGLRRHFADVTVVHHGGTLAYTLWWGLNHDALFETEEGWNFVEVLLQFDHALTQIGESATTSLPLLPLLHGTPEHVSSFVTGSLRLMDEVERDEEPDSSDSAAPVVSVVIIGWGPAPHLLGCLRSIELIDTSIPHEVIVTLNEPTADLLAALSESGVNARVISSRVNRGFGGACNAAARIARGDYVLFLNDDTVVDRGWLQPLVETAEGRSEIGAVGSLCLNPDGTVQEAGNFLWSDGTTSSATLDESGLAHRYDWARAVDYCSGASLLVRKSTWDRVHGFDEIYYPAYYEDLDLCLKIQAIGQEVWFQPASTVHHVRSASTTRPYREFLMHRHRAVLKERWSQVLEQHVQRSDDRVKDEEIATWLGMGRPDRILVIDDRIPDSSLGAGFGRMADAMSELLSAGKYFISFFAERDARRGLGRALPKGPEGFAWRSRIASRSPWYQLRHGDHLPSPQLWEVRWVCA